MHDYGVGWLMAGLRYKWPLKASSMNDLYNLLPLLRSSSFEEFHKGLWVWLANNWWHEVLAKRMSFAIATCKAQSVADQEIFRGGFSFTKTPAKLKVKKVFTSFLSYFSLTATGLATSRAHKPTHQPYFKVIAICFLCYRSPLIRIALFQKGIQLKPLLPPVSATVSTDFNETWTAILTLLIFSQARWTALAYHPSTKSMCWTAI